jgi:hypothetical protein
VLSSLVSKCVLSLELSLQTPIHDPTYIAYSFLKHIKLNYFSFSYSPHQLVTRSWQILSHNISWFSLLLFTPMVSTLVWLPTGQTSHESSVYAHHRLPSLPYYFLTKLSSNTSISLYWIERWSPKDMPVS